MVTIKIPSSFIEEREYVFNVIFGYFYELTYKIEVDENLSDRIIITRDEKEVILIDSFFKRAINASYLHADRLPQNVVLSTNQFTFEQDVPILYGTGNIEISVDKVVCYPDIIASIFFMLSRWEENVITNRDYLDRFSGLDSTAYRLNFLDRPVVNEWIEMLKNIINFVWPDIVLKKLYSYELILTHDIDLLSSPVSIKEFAKDILKRKSLKALYTRMGYLLRSKNPYNLFDYFMDVSEKNNIVSRFYFMTGHNIPGKDGESYNSTALYKSTLKKIKERGHIIGFHPSLLTYQDSTRFLNERKDLERDIDAKVTEGRQHALRFTLPDTWKMWDESGMKIDSTMGYSAIEGFRCGTGCIFPVFDILQRKELKLKEMPLIVMDTTLNVNRRLNIEESKSIFNKYISLGKKYQMPITLLFHNLIDDSIDWHNWKNLYNELFV